jgi:hypothetical protein
MKNTISILVLTAFLVALSACGNSDEKKANDETGSKKANVDVVVNQDDLDSTTEIETNGDGLVDEDTVKEDIEEVDEEIDEVEEVLPNVFPLTGIRTSESVNNRVVGVMINNHSRARQQSGLHEADVVYEALAEGNITRLLALYQSSKPKVVGPIRSARHYYMDLNNGFNGFYIHHGWSPLARDMVTSGKIENLNGLYFDGVLFKRASFRKAPHNSYITFDNILEGADRKGYSLVDNVDPLPFMSADEIDALAGYSAEKVQINYAKSYDVTYQYDKENNNYIRYSAGEQTVDLETETAITTNNIFIVEVDHYFIDSYPRRGLKLTTGGKGYLIGNGIVREVEWQNVNGRILPFQHGKELGFLPGKTWINIVPSNPGIATTVVIEGKEQD